MINKCEICIKNELYLIKLNITYNLYGIGIK